MILTSNKLVHLPQVLVTWIHELAPALDQENSAGTNINCKHWWAYDNVKNTFTLHALTMCTGGEFVAVHFFGAHWWNLEPLP